MQGNLRTLYWLMFSAALSTDAAAQNVQGYGIGLRSCATWMASESSQRAGENWILGAWTGMNLKNPKSNIVGVNSDGNGILGEVRNYCVQKPSAMLLEAVNVTYSRMQH